MGPVLPQLDHILLLSSGYTLARGISPLTFSLLKHLKETEMFYSVQSRTSGPVKFLQLIFNLKNFAMSIDWLGIFDR
jgi:hypothetical protein